MKQSRRRLAFLPLVAVAALGFAGPAAAQEPTPGIAAGKVPQPAVPEVFTLQGEFVRVAYNNEGYVTLGYRTANFSVGEEWMILQAGITLRHRVKDQALKRESFSVRTPDGKVIPLATQKEYAEANHLRALNARAKTVRDSLNYFPAEVTKAGAFQFFADLGTPGSSLSFDEVSLSDNRASVGRLFFRIPGGIQTGLHWLVVKFETSEVHVPFRILTQEEEKAFRKQWDDLKKALDEGMLK